jgi:serine/threonine protein kinase
MAMVWAARLKGSRGFQKIVAIKTMLPKLSEDEQFEQMFLDEASLASQIRHPHVVEIFDLGEENGILYLVMELVDGVPLNQLMKAAKKKGGIPLPIAVRLVMQACGGLHAAHELRDGDGQLVGLVHRDVSPQNILVTYEGVTKVVDFGIAKATAVGGGATVAGQIKGKVAYMAPEQVRGGHIDRRVDLFAIGIVLYALTTGKHPLRRESEAATMYNIASTDPVMQPSKVVTGYPIALERVVMQALAKDPNKRYQTANDLLRALDQALPASMRASTDDEVGAFVKGLFAERREDRQLALKRALELADRQAEGRVTRVASAQSAGTLTPVSTGSTSGSGVSSTVTSPGDSMPTAETMAGQFAPKALWRRQPKLLGAIAALALAAAGIAIVASVVRPHRDRAANEASPSAIAANDGRPKAADADAGAEGGTAEGNLRPGATREDAIVMPSDRIAQKKSEPSETKPTWVPSKPATAAPAETKPKPSAAPAPTAWKHDPGF